MKLADVYPKLFDRDEGPAILSSKWKKGLLEKDLMLLLSPLPNRSLGTKRRFFGAPFLWIPHDFNSACSRNKNRRTLICWFVIEVDLMKDD